MFTIDFKSLTKIVLCLELVVEFNDVIPNTAFAIELLNVILTNSLMTLSGECCTNVPIALIILWIHRGFEVLSGLGKMYQSAQGTCLNFGLQYSSSGFGVLTRYWLILYLLI